MSKRMLLLVATTLVSVGLVACSGTAPGGSISAATASEAATPEPVASRSAVQLPTTSPSPTPAVCPPATGGEGDACQIVPGIANIFGAGHDQPPAPGGGGAGTPPPVWTVPAGTTTMAVTSATGRVKPIPEWDWNGAGGGTRGATDVTSFGGISGLVHGGGGMFLVGVFLSDEALSGEAPERLDFTDQEDCEELSPEIGQTFFIGDGAGRRFMVPSGATRLFLGFVDGFFYTGEPGWYANNLGQLAVSVEFAAD